MVETTMEATSQNEISPNHSLVDTHLSLNAL